MPRDASKTRERILDAAQAVVLRRGFAGTSVDAIQEAAQISRGTFFYHFSSKDGMARALIERYARADKALIDDFMARATKLSSDPLQQALIFLALHEELFEETAGGDPGCLFASYSYEAGLFDPETHGLVVSSIEYWRAVLGGKLEEAMARHETRIPDTDPFVLAEMAYGVLQGAFILARSLDDAHLMVTHIRQFRSYLELLFGVVGETGDVTRDRHDRAGAGAGG